MALLRSGSLDEAKTRLEAILAAAPDEPDALQLLGMLARRQRDHHRAADLFRQSLRARPGQPHVLNNLGNTLLDLGRSDEAIGAYREAVRQQPGYVDALINLGIAELAEDRPALALEPLNQAIRADPADAKAQAALGMTLRMLGRLDEALAAFRASLTRRPDHVATRHNYAVALRLTGDAASAAAILRACAIAEPDVAEIRYNLGHCLYDLGQLATAADAYREAIERRPDYRDAHDSLNRLYWETGDQRYLASYVEAIVHDPRDAGLLADLANRLNLGGQTREAAALIDDALARGVDAPALRERLGQARAAMGDLPGAIDQFQAAIDAAPASIAPRLELARAQIILARYAEALSILGPALQMAPFDQQAIAYKGLAWRLAGDPRATSLIDADRFVTEQILHPPVALGDVTSFNHRLETALARHHRTSRHPLEQTLRGGTQTMGDLFALPDPEIRAVRGMIEEAVARYIATLPEDSDHVFLKRRSKGFEFAGSWSVRLRAPGYHLNHVHAQGWISSCYYVGLPNAVAKGNDRQGWLKIGETGLGLGDREQIERAIRPEIGKLVLFPSYFYHGTYPFEDDGFRTTIAFDVVPAAR